MKDQQWIGLRGPTNSQPANQKSLFNCQAPVILNDGSISQANDEWND